MISAQGELQASETLAQAARMLASQPASLTLRYLQTISEIAAENNSTTIFPVPIEMLRPFFQRADDAVAAATPAGAGLPPALVPGAFGASLPADAAPQVRFDPAKKLAGE